MNEDSVKAAFAEQVDAVVKLRDFMVSERHSYAVPDRIIDDIEAARQIAIMNRTPSAQERASLSKAQRDLVAVPTTSITYSGIPPAEFWQCGSAWTNAMAILCAAPAVLLLFYVNRQLISDRAAWSFHWHLPTCYAVTSASLIWALYVFTGVATDKKLNRMIGTCYVFTLIALGSSIVPFVFGSSDLGTAPAQIGLIKGCAVSADKAIPDQVKCDDKIPSGGSQWVVNIGGLAIKANDFYKISGGLVVPLYVVVLALFGSAVSMTRRVPEYQRSAMSAADPMTNVEARERLVFQIMQVASAPLIAVTAFSIVKPASVSEAVLVGFGSGFASEPILLMIRSLVDKMTPARAAAAGTVAVKVSPAASTPKPGDTIAFNAQVTGLPNAAVTWRLEPDDPASGTITVAGLYTAPVPLLADKDVTVIATSAADLNKSGTAAIKLAPPAPIALAAPPVPVTMKPNDRRHFTVGDGATPAVWTLDPAVPASGTLMNGDYTAPAVAPAAPVGIAAKQADGTLIGSATVTIAS